MWDNHVQFGLKQPELYLVMFGNIRPESRPAIVADAEALMEEMLNKAAVSGQLNVPPKEAARSILAANVGVTLMLIAEKAPERNLELSTMTRDAMIFAVSTEQARDNGSDDSRKILSGCGGHRIERSTPGVPLGPALQLGTQALPRMAPPDLHQLHQLARRNYRTILRCSRNDG